MPCKNIVAIGGGGFGRSLGSLEIEKYIVSLSNKKRPKICFIPTASGDSSLYKLNFYKSITKGKGWLLSKKGIIVAFATRYPNDRIALFYCKGKFQRKGCGSKLLHKLEDEAKKEGLHYLSTEASLISYKLFLKYKWSIIRKEKVNINNIFFERYKMIKIIKTN